MITDSRLFVFFAVDLRQDMAVSLPKTPSISQDDDDKDDGALFREAIGEVRLIKTPEPAVKTLKPKAESRMFQEDEAQALRDSRSVSAVDAYLFASDVMSYRRDETPEKWFKQLKRGQISVQDELDLHHCRAHDAEIILKQFLNQAREEGHHCVRVVHGKGMRSEGSPVLKNLVDKLLRHRGDVLAFHSAPASQGGTGAVLVLLAKRL
jgi:DNA-nicking Smr family endonuclease